MRSLLSVLGCVIVLAACGLAHSSSVHIESGSNSIKGTATDAPLGQVLERLAETIGCDIFIDAPLVDEPISFTISEKTTPENAIKRMVRPHSYAMVFGNEENEEEPRLLEVWIFRRGEQHSASYVPLRKSEELSEGSQTSANVVEHSEALEDDPSESSGSTSGRNLVRRDLHVEKSPFGTPVVKGRDRRRGPDYRPSPYQMRLAYERYRIAKRREELRMAEMTIRHAQNNSERRRQAYLSKRNQEVKNQIMEMKQNNP
jgi:hypothetical protein